MRRPAASRRPGGRPNLPNLPRRDPADPATWTPRPPSPARTTAVILQSVAIGLVALALLASLWWLATSTTGAAPGTLLSAVLMVPVTIGMIVLGWTGLQRWLAGGPPTRLYGFDALPIIFLIATAGPGALQDLLGLGITVAFALPGLATFLATSR